MSDIKLITIGDAKIFIHKVDKGNSVRIDQSYVAFDSSKFRMIIVQGGKSIEIELDEVSLLSLSSALIDLVGYKPVQELEQLDPVKVMIDVFRKATE